MRRRIQTYLMMLLASGVLAAAVMVPAAYAIDLFPACTNIENVVCEASGEGGDKVDTIVTRITNLLMWALGIVSVIMLVIGGFKFTTSGGSPEQVKSAKNTIMYAIIGIVVAIVAWAVVDFVVKQL